MSKRRENEWGDTGRVAMVLRWVRRDGRDDFQQGLNTGYALALKAEGVLEGWEDLYVFHLVMARLRGISA